MTVQILTRGYLNARPSGCATARTTARSRVSVSELAIATTIAKSLERNIVDSVHLTFKRWHALSNYREVGGLLQRFVGR